MAPDDADFAGLLERQGPGLFNYLLHRLGRREEAEDVYAEVFMKAWQGWGAYREQGRAQAWLFTIARRSCVDAARRGRHRRTEALETEVDGVSLLDKVPSPEPGPEREAEGGYARARIARALAELPVEQREVFLMREFGGLSFAEVAAATECPLPTALARMRYAVQKLRARLGDLDA